MKSVVKDKLALSKICEDASVEEGFSIIKELEKVLKKEQGIGLAANQIGIDKKVCIVRVPHGEEIIGHNFINPAIVSKEDPIVFKGEGCLSFPKERLETLRYNKIRVVDSLSPNGREFTGMEAVCANHEIDHLFGITMHDSILKKIGRNDSCPCGSQKKFKKCCLKILNVKS